MDGLQTFVLAGGGRILSSPHLKLKERFEIKCFVLRPKFMKKIIIFDFNRTIYDPDNGCLISGARFVLRTLLRRGFSLYLVSRAGKSRRELIKNLGIGQYFSRAIIAKEKSKKDFERIVAPKVIERSLSFVVGDRVRKEISIGNLLGLKTVWLKSGKFANEKPRKKVERPTYTVRTFREIVSVIH